MIQWFSGLKEYGRNNEVVARINGVFVRQGSDALIEYVSSSTKQLQRENAKKMPYNNNNNNNKKLEDWIFSHDVVCWAAECFVVRLFFSV